MPYLSCLVIWCWITKNRNLFAGQLLEPGLELVGEKAKVSGLAMEYKTN